MEQVVVVIIAVFAAFAVVYRPVLPTLRRLTPPPRDDAPPTSRVRRIPPNPRTTVLALAVAVGGPIPVPLVLRTLQFPNPGGERERTLFQARAALEALWQDGVVELEPLAVPPGRERFYVRGTDGRLFGLVKVTMDLEKAREEIRPMLQVEAAS